jgi:hypothetical protein
MEGLGRIGSGLNEAEPDQVVILDEVLPI